MSRAPSIRVLVHQGGPVVWPRSTSVLTRLARELDRSAADLVVLSELAFSPYFATAEAIQPDSAATLDGPEVAEAVVVARAHDCLIALPLALSGGRGTVRNTCVLVGPDGLVTGRMVSGPNVGAASTVFAKVHLSENRSASPGVHEKYHFVPGDGFLTWGTRLGVVAPLICYDRSFPEAWRTVADSGAEIVVVPIATSRPERVRMLEAELTVAALQNGVFVVAACKAGTETVDGGTVIYSGGSLVVGPDGAVIRRAPSADGDLFFRATLDLEALERYPRTFHYARDRRPGAYLRPAEPSCPSDPEATDA